MSQGDFLWGVDIVSARAKGIASLPQPASQIVFGKLPVRIADPISTMCATKATETLKGTIIEDISSEQSNDNKKSWKIKDYYVKIGRNRDNDITLHDRSVSRYHAVLYAENSEIFLVDLASTYGTTVEGKHLAPHKPYPIQIGQTFSLGSYVTLKLSC